MMTVIRNILKYARYHTKHKLFKKICTVAIKPLYESTTRLIYKLTFQAVSDPDPKINIRELTASDINQMLDVMYVSRRGLQQRFDIGERCFAVLENGKILSYFWAQFGIKDFYEVHLKFNLSDNQAWMYNAITVKKARGRGYYPNIIRYMVKVLKVDGFNEFFIDVEETNRASIRGIEKAGCRQVVKVQMRRLLSNVRYKVTIFDKDAWRELSEIISDFPGTYSVIEGAVNGS